MAFRAVGVRAVVKDIGKYVRDMDKMDSATKKAVDGIIAQLKKEVNVRKSLEFSARKIALAVESESIKRIKLSRAIDDQIDSLNKIKKDYGEASREMDDAVLSIDNLAVALKKSELQIETLDDKFQDIGQSIDESEKRTDAFGDELLELSTAATKTKIPIKEIAIGLAAIGAAVVIAVAAIKTLINIVKKLATIVLAPFKKVFEILKNITVAVTRFVVDLGKRAISSALDALANAIRNAARAAVEGAVAFQKLSIRFQGLIAQEVIATGHVNDFSRAMRLASGPAKGLLQWMQKLALATPFTRRDITETVAFSTAMGFTTKQAKQLVLSIGNFVAGMGLSTEVMERVILQFGQMQAGGKLFGTELRDLARGAFVPVNTIIRRVAENAGMAASAWQDLAARGKTDIQPFFDEFITLVGERFPDAMDRMNRTMEAVIQNAGEFVKEFLGVKLLLPAVEKLSGRAADALEAVVSDEVLKAFELAGLRVGGFVDRIIDLVGAISEAVLGTRDFRQMAITLAAFLSVIAEKASRLVDIVDDELIGFAERIGGSARDAFQWGVDLIVEFSRGIIISTSGVLVQAMQFVGGMLSKWLKGTSPPLVAPDIDIWGANALTEWLKGMSLADFSVLEGLQAPLKRALGALEAAGEIAEDDIAPAFAAISIALTEALAGGEVGQNVFDVISEHLGDFADELNELIREELELQYAIRAVMQAEQDLENARRGFTDQSLEVRRLTREYNELLRVGSDPAILRAKLAEINAAENAREAAREQVAASEVALEAAEDRVDPLEDQVRLQEAILRQLIAMTEAQFDMDDVTDSVSEAEASIADLIAEMGSVGASMDEVADAFREARATIIAEWATMFSGLREAWEGDITDAFTGLKDQFEQFKWDVIDPFLVALGLKEPPDIKELRKLALAGDLEEYLKWMERIKELEEGPREGVPLPPGGMGTFPEWEPQGIMRTIADIKKTVEGILTDIKEAVRIQIEVLLDPILPNFITLIDNSVVALDELTTMLNLQGESTLSPLAQALMIINALLNATIKGLSAFVILTTETFMKGGILDRVIRGETPALFGFVEILKGLAWDLPSAIIEGFEELSNAVNQVEPPTSEDWAEYAEALHQIEPATWRELLEEDGQQPFLYGFSTEARNELLGPGGALEQVEEFSTRVEQNLNNLKDNTVGHSIIPDMLSAIVIEFRDKFAEIEIILDEFAIKFTDTFAQLGIDKPGGLTIKDKMKGAIVSAPPTSNQTSVSFGDTNINDQMDAATFFALVQQAVTGAL